MGVPRAVLLFVAIVAVLALPAPARAQASNAFLQALATVITASDGTYGDEGPALTAAIDAMAGGLAQWDAAVGRAESGFKAEIGGAVPSAAARMRGALGTIYLERGRLDAAIAQFEAASALEPQLANLHLLKGAALELAGRVDEAAGAYRAAWQRDRGSATSAYLFLRSASAADASPDLSAAMEALSSAVTRSLDAAVPPARFLVVGLLDDGSVPSPAFPRALYATAFDLLRQSKYEDAIAKFRDAAAVDPLVTDSALRRAAVTEAADAVRRDRADSAVPALAAAVAQAAGSSELHRMLGTAYWAARRYGEALEQFRTAVGLAPRDERSRLAMADVLQAMGDASGARQALLDTLRAIPESQQAQWKLGRLHQSVGDERGALDAFDAAWKHPPLAGAGHLLAAIGRLHHARLDLESAVDVYARRVRGTPNDVAAHLDLADVLRADDRLSEASREALVAALLDPGSARAFATIGQLLVSGGRDAEGERMLRQAVTLDPAHLEAHYGLSRVLLRLGRAEDAARELEVYRQLQAKAMEDERRRFRDNQQRLEETLRAGESKEPVR